MYLLVEIKIQSSSYYLFLLTIICLIALFFIIIIFFILYRKCKNLKDTSNQLADKTMQIVDQQKEITDSIQYAKRLQQAIFPAEEYCLKILPDHFIFFSPKSIVSGDFFWVGRKEDRTIIAVADSTGHGVPGAILSILGITLLNEIVNKNNLTRPDIILNELRENVIVSLRQKEDDNFPHDGMELSICSIDKNQNLLYFAGANRPIYIIRETENKQKEFIEIKGDKMQASLHDNILPFKNHYIKYKKNDVFYLFSDGYADQIGGKNNKRFTTGKLKNLLLNISSESMDEQRYILKNNLKEWKINSSQNDDILIIGIRL